MDDHGLHNYTIEKTLGFGSFGKVKLALHKPTGHKVAIKILNRAMIQEHNMEDKVRKEIKIMRVITHPHIVRLYEVIETTSKIYFVMEYVTSGELFDYLVENGRLHESQARRLFQQIISGLEYCHQNMVVHRDLKPENLLLDSNYNIKIADFGFSNIIRDGHFLKTSCGSLNYAAPEVVSGALYAGPEVDVWSCGVILYALLCGSLPFDGDSVPLILKKIKIGCYPKPRHLSAVAQHLIAGMLEVDPLKRITIPKIRQSSWFQADLPHYLAAPFLNAQQVRIDQNTVEEVVRMGYDRDQLIASLFSRHQNEGTVVYYLLFDNRFHASDGFPAEADNFHNIMDNNQLSAAEAGSLYGIGSIRPLPVQRKWSLGLQSRARPREIMIEVMKALQELNVTWKTIGHYNIKCRWIPDIIVPEQHECCSPNALKFEVQVYKTLQGKYLVDLQWLHGPQMLFLELCAAFLAQLHVI